MLAVIAAALLLFSGHPWLALFVFIFLLIS